MPLVGQGLSLGPELIDGIEDLRAFRAHWVTYSFSISKQRAELCRIGRRRHDGLGPFRSPLPTASSSPLDSPEKNGGTRGITGAEIDYKNPVGRPRPKYSSIPGFDVLTEPGGANPGSPSVDSLEHPFPASPSSTSSSPLANLSVSMRYYLAQFLDPEAMLVLSMTGTSWFELGVSEVLWQLLASRMDAVGGMHNISAIRNQRIAVRDVGFADGRAWASACLFSESWNDLVESLPETHGLFILADFLNAPGSSAHSLPRRTNLETAISPYPAQHIPPGVPDRRPLLLLFWDPAGSPLVYRRAQFDHLKKVEDSHKICFPDVTHIMHCRTKKDLSVNRLANWLALGFGVRGSVFANTSAWDVTAVDTVGLPGKE